MTRNVTIAHTPDTDDAFYFEGIRSGAVETPGCTFTFVGEHIHDLNLKARQGVYDLTAISSVTYLDPEVSRRYRIADAGTSVGRGYGPVLAARNPIPIEALSGRRVGVAGYDTTGGVLMRLANPEAILVEVAYDRMAQTILVGEIDAGVMIHEELLAFPDRELQRVEDLGKRWCERNELPLPVGLNLVHRRLGDTLARDIVGWIAQSIRFGLDHFDETLAAVQHLSRGHSESFVRMFANQDSAHLAPDVQQAIAALFDQVAPVFEVDAPIVDIVFPTLDTNGTRSAVRPAGT
ncbi:MAG: hypothetical protein H6834_08150 [Planctomycetes bacterium]|nr:hypothetical protein [Planctomycetota bacterium]